jgi:predicted metal-binding membrane protein
MPAGSVAELRVRLHRQAFLLLMAGLVALMWIALWLWQLSPYGRYLDHGGWTQLGLAAALCRVVPNGEIVLPALLYVLGWVLMSAAMMLPTAMPLLLIFREVTIARSNRRQLLLLLVVGYLAIWALFGLAAHSLDQLLLALVNRVDWLFFNGWVLGAVVFAFAGLYQFSTLKYRCLDRCRTPLSFVVERWRGGDDRKQAFAIGLAHGLFCVGCCWALMLLMFVVGTTNLGVMMALGAVMAAEKNWPAARIAGKPLGFALLGWSLLIILQHSA